MTLYLAGGGTFHQERLVWREAFAGVRRVVYWPFALPDSRIVEAGAWLASAVTQLEIEVDEIDIWPELDGRSAGDLAQADLLFVGGGSSSKLAAHVREHGFADVVRDYIAGGGRYYGGSAGAVLAGNSIAIAALADSDPDAAGRAGLGLLPGLAVLPHSDTFAPKAVANWAAELAQTVVAIPEASGLAIGQGAARVIGPDPISLVRRGGTTEYAQGTIVPLVA
jgi:dipeptidase E